MTSSSTEYTLLGKTNFEWPKKTSTVDIAASPFHLAASEKSRSITSGTALSKETLHAKLLTEWKPRYLDHAIALESMVKNALKATLDHLPLKRPELSTPKEWLPSVESAASVKKLTKPLTMSMSIAADIGCRETMQDRSFIITLSDGKILAAVFDGHRGDAVAEYLEKEFQNQFVISLEKAKDNIHQVLEETIQEMQNQIAAKKIPGGAAAVICYIDPLLGTIYTATVGDSEAMILREKDGVTLPIFLSPLRNWSIKKEQLRAEAICGKSFHLKIPEDKSPKSMRGYVDNKGGLNLSRSIGNQDLVTTDGKRLLNIKPKISIQLLYPGDTVLLCSDGIPDSMSVTDIIKGLDPKCEEEIQKAEVHSEIMTRHLKAELFSERIHNLLIDCLDAENYEEIDEIIDEEIECHNLTKEQGDTLKLNVREKFETRSGRSGAELLIDYAAKVKYAFDNVTACVLKIT